MRIYEGSPRQDFEEVLRSIGLYLDSRGMRDVMVIEAPDGFIVQGLAHVGASSSTWSESVGQVEKETMTFLDEDIARFMDEAVARRGTVLEVDPARPGYYEHSFRVIGRYLDGQHPKDIFFFEQDGAFLLRLHHATQTGDRHTLVEFTKDDVEALIAQSPTLRSSAPSAGSQGATRG
jgi:hypothetical protein